MKRFRWRWGWLTYSIKVPTFLNSQAYPLFFKKYIMFPFNCITSFHVSYPKQYTCFWAYLLWLFSFQPLTDLHCQASVPQIQPQPTPPKLVTDDLASPASSHPDSSISSTPTTSDPHPQLQAHLWLLFPPMLSSQQATTSPIPKTQQMAHFLSLLTVNSLPTIPSLFYSTYFKLVFQSQI